MTSAPPALLSVRSLLLEHLGPHGLDPAEVGVVGDANHYGGYHVGKDRVISGDYSVVESRRDRDGLSDYASALDVGTFSVKRDGKTHNLQSFSRWLAAECARGAPDTADIREVIYSPDGKTVKRWDRLRVRSSGDSSHLWHTHISYHRDATKAGRDLTPLYRRYLATIGLIDDGGFMAKLTDDQQRHLYLMAINIESLLSKLVTGATERPEWDNKTAKYKFPRVSIALNSRLRDIADRLATATAPAPPAPVQVDAATVAATLAGDAAFVDAIAQALADEVARRMAE